MSVMGMKFDFSSWLQSEVNRRNWTQSDLARAAQLNRAVINKVMNRKTDPRPTTLEAIARAFRLPTEAVYRAAGLLPNVTEDERFSEEVANIFDHIQDPQRRATALTLLRALITEDEDEHRDNPRD